MNKRLILLFATLALAGCGETIPTKDKASQTIDEQMKAWHPATDATTTSSTAASTKTSKKAATSRSYSIASELTATPSQTLDDFGIRDKSLKAWHPATDATIRADSPARKPATQTPAHRSFSIASELTVHPSKDAPKP